MNWGWRSSFVCSQDLAPFCSPFSLTQLLYSSLTGGDAFERSRRTVLEALMRKFSSVESAFELMVLLSFFLSLSPFLSLARSSR